MLENERFVVDPCQWLWMERVLNCDYDGNFPSIKSVSDFTHEIIRQNQRVHKCILHKQLEIKILTEVGRVESYDRYSGCTPGAGKEAYLSASALARSL